MKTYSRVYAKIDLDAIAYNMEQMKDQIGKEARLIAVIKTDGYGHGAVPIARMFETFSYVWGYAVACIEEAVSLRKEGIKKPILVLGCVFPDQYETMIKNEIRAAVYTKEMAEGMSDEAVRQGKNAYFHTLSRREWYTSSYCFSNSSLYFGSKSFLHRSKTLS